MLDTVNIGLLALSETIYKSQISLSANYDFGVVCVGWESRTVTALSMVDKFPERLIAIRFASDDHEVNKKKDDNWRSISKSHKTTELLEIDNSLQFNENVRVIEQLILDAFVKAGRPLRLLLDITSMPKSYMLFILGMGFSKSIIARMDCLYSEGIYSSRDYQDDIQSDGSISKRIVSEGDWQSLLIPYLESEIAIPKNRDIIVIMGGELGFSLPFVDKYEPRNIGVVLIKDGLLQDAIHLSTSERDGLAELLSEGSVDRQDIDLLSAIAVARYAVARCSASTSESLTGIAIGAKPHALALGLAALAESKLEIICRVPKRYKSLDVSPTGRVALYEVEDRFEPEAYF